MDRKAARKFFLRFNRDFMVPAFRLGLGPLIGNPITGYVMVLKTIGHKTGMVRYAPVNYALLDGQIYCIAGWGTIAHWYRNLKADPEVEVIMPGGNITGIAEEVTDPREVTRARRQVLKNSGFAGFLAGFNPYTITDDALREKTRDMPVIRICPDGLAGGAGDPGGWLWLLTIGLHVAFIAWLGRKKRG